MPLFVSVLNIFIELHCKVLNLFSILLRVNVRFRLFTYTSGVKLSRQLQAVRPLIEYLSIQAFQF